jgi:aminoglycoside 2''-phosphotransferase
MNHDSNLAAFLKVSSQIYPNLQIRSGRLHDPDEGQYNNVITAVTDLGPIIFRFPRNDIGVETIRNELRILGRLQNQTTLPVPNPIYISQETEMPGQVFMGYPMLPGRPLLRENMKTAALNTTLKKWARQMVQFLVELHTVPVKHFGDLPQNEKLAEFEELYHEIQEHLFPHMNEKTKQKTAVHFETYFNRTDLHTYPVALRHGDFGTGNLLYDPDTLNLTGVIDFGFSGLGDPAVDIAALSTLGDTFFTYVRDFYPNVDPLLTRARFYKRTFLLYEALYGLKTGNDAIFSEAIAVYGQKPSN